MQLRSTVLSASLGVQLYDICACGRLCKPLCGKQWVTSIRLLTRRPGLSSSKRCRPSQRARYDFLGYQCGLLSAICTTQAIKPPHACSSNAFLSICTINLLRFTVSLEAKTEADHHGNQWCWVFLVDICGDRACAANPAAGQVEGGRGED